MDDLPEDTTSYGMNFLRDSPIRPASNDDPLADIDNLVDSSAIFPDSQSVEDLMKEIDNMAHSFDGSQALLDPIVEFDNKENEVGARIPPDSPKARTLGAHSRVPLLPIAEGVNEAELQVPVTTNDSSKERSLVEQSRVPIQPIREKANEVGAPVPVGTTDSSKDRSLGDQSRPPVHPMQKSDNLENKVGGKVPDGTKPSSLADGHLVAPTNRVGSTFKLPDGLSMEDLKKYTALLARCLIDRSNAPLHPMRESGHKDAKAGRIVPAGNTDSASFSKDPSLNVESLASNHASVESTAPRTCVPVYPNLPKDVIDIDFVDLVSENFRAEPRLAAEIHQKQLDRDLKARLLPDYLSNPECTIVAEQRNAFVDVIVSFHALFKLSPRTLYLAVDIFDRVLTDTRVKTEDLLLICYTSLWIAHKCVEDLPISRALYIKTTQNQFTWQDLLVMEAGICMKLGFNFHVRTALDFAERALKALYARTPNANVSIRSFAFYMLDLALCEYEMRKYKPSELGAASVAVAAFILAKDKVSWDANMRFHTGYKKEQLDAAGKFVLSLVLCDGKKKLGGANTSVKYKYSTQEYGSVAHFPVNFLAAQADASEEN